MKKLFTLFLVATFVASLFMFVAPDVLTAWGGCGGNSQAAKKKSAPKETPESKLKAEIAKALEILATLEKDLAAAEEKGDKKAIKKITSKIKKVKQYLAKRGHELEDEDSDKEGNCKKCGEDCKCPKKGKCDGKSTEGCPCKKK